MHYNKLLDYSPWEGIQNCMLSCESHIFVRMIAQDVAVSVTGSATRSSLAGR